MTLRVPVAMMVFNRPAHAARVLDAVRAARPARLLVVADGPRRSHPGEAERCAAVRGLFDRVDWPCEVERAWADENLGCRRRLSTGLDWVFDRAEEAIVLEDDCLPDPTFFPYCEELLARYRDESRVMAVTGANFQGRRRRGAGSYYFSRYMHVWGWASWRRAWRHYDVEMRTWPAFRDGGRLAALLGDARAASRWTEILDRTHAGAIGTWDYQWLYAIWAQGGLVATPNVNLVTNIGGGDEATHTQGSSLMGRARQPLAFPLVHPGALAADEAADRFVQRKVFDPTVRARVGAVLQRLLGRRTPP